MRIVNEIAVARTPAVLAALLLLPFAFAACQTSLPDDGVQVWVTGWPGSNGGGQAEAILLRGADLQCGIGEAGEISFVPAQAANRAEFPDGSVVRAGGIKLVLKRSEGNETVGIGPYSLEMLFVGKVIMIGPFANHIQGWLGKTPEGGEAMPLVSGKLEGPLVIRCPVEVSSVMASGRTMIFGSLAKIGVKAPPGEGEEEKKAEEGKGETPKDSSGG
ncbi:MAG: hypothetical protein ACYS47_17575 [Planctomycetota bacterium]